MTHFMQWNKIDLLDDAARFPHTALHHMIVGDAGGLFRSPAYLVRALTGSDAHAVTVTSEPDQDGNTVASTVFWLTEPECIAMINAFADTAHSPGIIAAVKAGFMRAAHVIALKREKVAERAARPRTVSDAIADAAERLECSASTIYTATRTMFGPSKAMPPDVARTAIEWLDAMTEKPSLKKPAAQTR
ncbi:MAG: hypothetical protein Q7S99_03055 [Parvibaculum sp.]|nr:hypothetical protein [Parvibaculum sp.]